MNDKAIAAPKLRRPPLLQLILLACAQFIVALDYNIIYIALPEIGQALHFSAASLQWVISAYAIGFGGFLLLGGRAADKLGHRRMFILGLSLFGAASLLGGFTPNAGLLIAARLLQGIGAAFLTPATLSLINITFAEGRERNKALAVWGAAGSGGLAVGALLGGALTAWVGWQWVLFVMIPLTVLAIIGARHLLVKDAFIKRTTKGFDILGALLATLSSVALVFSLIQGPQIGWLSYQTITGFVASIVLLTALVLLERKSRNPLIPLKLLRNNSLLTSIAVILIFQAMLGGGYYLLTIFLQVILGYSALLAGLAFLPVTIASMIGSFKMTPYLLSKHGVRPVLFGGMLVTGLGFLILIWGMQQDGSLWLLLPGLIIWGLGGGVTFPTMFIAAASGVKPDEQGIASAIASTSQQIGGAIGLALLIALATAHVSSFENTEQSVILQGLHMAGIVGGILAVAGAFLAWAMKKDTN